MSDLCHGGSKVNHWSTILTAATPSRKATKQSPKLDAQSRKSDASGNACRGILSASTTRRDCTCHAAGDESCRVRLLMQDNKPILLRLQKCGVEFLWGRGRVRLPNVRRQHSSCMLFLPLEPRVHGLTRQAAEPLV